MHPQTADCDVSEVIKSQPFKPGFFLAAFNAIRAPQIVGLIILPSFSILGLRDLSVHALNRTSH